MQHAQRPRAGQGIGDCCHNCAPVVDLQRGEPIAHDPAAVIDERAAHAEATDALGLIFDSDPGKVCKRGNVQPTETAEPVTGTKPKE